MYKLQVVLEYDGSGYHGFQNQGDRSRPTVQGEFERILEGILGERVAIEGSGRTDRGVHALGQVVSFRVGRDEIPPDGLVRMLACGLPDAMRIRRWQVVPDSFHPRRGVTRKSYLYLLVFGRPIKPFQRHYVWNVPHGLDVGAMRQAAPVFVGTHDFSAFANGGREPVDRVRTISRLRVFEVPHASGTLAIRVTGNGFLHRMVRRITGALVDVGRGRLTPDDLARIVAARRPDASYTIAPPNGLYLARVEYDTATGSEPHENLHDQGGGHPQG